MRPAITLVDYGAGNLASVVRGLEAAGASVRIATASNLLDDAHAMVVPGVGHFGQTAGLDERWRAHIHAALEAGRPLLGICLGMQWLFEGSEEAPALPGLGVLPGRCVRLRGGVKVPHVGWNQLELARGGSRLLHGVPAPAYGYFAHSYAVPPGDDAVAVTTHGIAFASVVERGRVFGIQCHPEKSADTGLVLLRNFVGFVRERGTGRATASVRRDGADEPGAAGDGRC